MKNKIKINTKNKESLWSKIKDIIKYTKHRLKGNYNSPYIPWHSASLDEMINLQGVQHIGDVRTAFDPESDDNPFKGIDVDQFLDDIYVNCRGRKAK